MVWVIIFKTVLLGIVAYRGGGWSFWLWRYHSIILIWDMDKFLPFQPFLMCHWC